MTQSETLATNLKKSDGPLEMATARSPIGLARGLPEARVSQAADDNALLEATRLCDGDRPRVEHGQMYVHTISDTRVRCAPCHTHSRIVNCW